ncbi:baseplate assembly protein [Vibrio sp. ER1A]|uniref:baseplate assembly protein n=1 Tax=Vibrio sp. ER1A TaxID=1517681 RepID=UPI0004DD7AE0|nr:baseplate J/gp47 family protein [Vibrio sp. ER1A]KFA98780.1 baseplate assembly protein [Vibrio sp. ER1A]
MSQIVISDLPPPEVVQQLDTSLVHQRMLNRYAELQGVEVPKIGDPLYNAMASMTEEVTRARQEFQDISLNNMVAFSNGANLEHLGAARPVEKFDSETDDEYRRRVQMAPEGFSTAGPDGAYIFHALNAHEDVLDSKVHSPEEVVVNQYILSRQGDGTASDELCNIVSDYVSAAAKRPLSDRYTVLPAEIIPYRIELELEMLTGPGEAQTIELVTQKLKSLTKSTHVLEGFVSLSAIDGAAHLQTVSDSVTSFQPVRDVVMIEPTNKIECTKSQAPYCTEIVVRKKVA